MNETILSKYGGSSITCRDDVDRIAHITAVNPHRKYIVVSAPGCRNKGDTKVTQLLVKLASAEEKQAQSLIAEIASRYEAIYPHCEKEIIDSLSDRYQQKLSPKVYLDSLKAFGEETNARYLARELRAQFVDPKDFLSVSGDFGQAKVLKSSYTKIKKLQQELGKQRESGKQRLLVIPGFYGYTAKGEVATFSFGGSDLTGAIFARGLDVEIYENFTDCPIYAANPQIVENPMIIPEITYKELRDLSYSGFSIFHQEAMFPLEGTTITTHVRSTKKYPEEGTKVLPERISSLSKPIVGIAYKGGFCSFSLEKSGLNEIQGILYRILGIFEKRKLSVEFPAVGIDDVSIVLNQEQVVSQISPIKKELSDIVGGACVKFRDNLGCLVVAGKELQRNSRISGEIEIALADNNLEVRSISRGVERRCLIYGVDMEDGFRAVNVLYDRFIR